MELTSPRTIRAIADRFGFTFKKGLGQNFLTSPEVLEKIAQAAEIEDGVLEIGPGFGVLTQTLCEYAEKVVAVEIDSRLNEVLEFTLSGYRNVKVINADIMKTDIKKLIRDEFGDKRISVAANLPYYITTPVITRLLEEKLPINNIVVMVQKEVAQRLCALPGGKDYGAITLLCRYFTSPEIITNVKAGLFVPPPKVDSAVVRLKMLDTPAVSVKSEDMFFKTVRFAFAQRRKTLMNCLSSGFGIPKDELSDIFEKANIEPSRRGETLSIEEFANMADRISEYFG